MNAPKTDVERNTMLALAESVEAGCSLQTQRSLQNVDENLLNYELIENLVAYILRTERTHGVQALIGRQPGQVRARKGQGQVGGREDLGSIRVCEISMYVMCLDWW